MRDMTDEGECTGSVGNARTSAVKYIRNERCDGIRNHA